MLVKEIEYKDFNGKNRKEKFMFNLTPAEVLEFEMSRKGGITEMMKEVVESEDVATIISVFKELILKSYGVKSSDGIAFVKSKELSDKFSQTNAYSNLFMELAFDSDAAAKFINGVTSSVIEETEETEETKKEDLDIL